jgi:hypothetical protein
MSQNHWYTIEYDENNIAWLVDDTNRRLCLEHGMRLYVAGWTLPEYARTTPEPAAGREGER